MKVAIFLFLSMIILSNCMYYQILDAVAHLKTKEQFKIWHYLNEKKYDLNTLEGLSRYKNFKNNLAYITKRNSEQSEFQLGLGPFADMSFEEFSKTMLLSKDNKESNESFLRNLKANPINFEEMADDDELIVKNKDVKNAKDWSSVFGTARHQGGCGSCWAYGTTGVIEAAAAIKEGVWSALSTQQLVDCDTQDHGCNGGFYFTAFQYTIDNGVESEAAYPYEGVQRSCRYNANKVTRRVKSYKYCTGSTCTHNALESMLAQGPVATAVEANQDFMNYRGGVLDSPCYSNINHAVIIVHLTDQYVKLRNSWGPGWGENGYIRLRHNENNNGSCFTERYAFLPVL